jgi:hypothetical protein
MKFIADNVATFSDSGGQIDILHPGDPRIAEFLDQADALALDEQGFDRPSGGAATPSRGVDVNGSADEQALVNDAAGFTALAANPDQARAVAGTTPTRRHPTSPDLDDPEATTRGPAHRRTRRTNDNPPQWRRHSRCEALAGCDPDPGPRGWNLSPTMLRAGPAAPVVAGSP